MGKSEPKGAKREPKGGQSEKGSQTEPKGAKGSPKGAKGNPKGCQKGDKMFPGTIFARSPKKVTNKYRKSSPKLLILEPVSMTNP